jgi:RNA polymerase sigma-70 factor (ECF subfamily)
MLAFAPAEPRQMDALIRVHRPSVYAFIRRRGFSREDADDLTQETFLRACRHLSALRGGAVRPWLLAIARNLAIDHLRRRALRTVPLDVVATAGSREDDPQSATAGDLCGRALSLVEELPDPYRQLVRMRYLESRSFAEIAQLTHCTPDAARQRLFRAVSALRKRCWRGEPG